MDWGKFLFYAQYILPGLDILLCCCFIEWCVRGHDSCAERIRRRRRGRVPEEPFSRSLPPRTSFQALVSPQHAVPVVVVGQTASGRQRDPPHGSEHQHDAAAIEAIPVASSAPWRNRVHSLLQQRSSGIENDPWMDYEDTAIDR
jgi:hypothetical protein